MQFYFRQPQRHRVLLLIALWKSTIQECFDSFNDTVMYLKARPVICAVINKLFIQRHISDKETVMAGCGFTVVFGSLYIPIIIARHG